MNKFHMIKLVKMIRLLKTFFLKKGKLEVKE